MCADRFSRMRGQALAETLVVAIVLVPLAVLVLMLGKYQSIRSATVMASRSLAFDCAARPSDCGDAAGVAVLVAATRQRHFAGGPQWRDHAGRPLLENLADVDGTLARQRFDAGLATAAGRAASTDLRGIGGAGLAVASVLGGLAGPPRFGLGTEDGLLEASVRTEVARSRAGAAAGFPTLDPPTLALHARTVVLTDAWNASGPGGGPASVSARVAAGAQLDSLREARLAVGYQLTRWSIDLMGAIGLEPSASQFRHRHTDPDSVPADRLGQP